MAAEARDTGVQDSVGESTNEARISIPSGSGDFEKDSDASEDEGAPGNVPLVLST